MNSLISVSDFTERPGQEFQGKRSGCSGERGFAFIPNTQNDVGMVLQILTNAGQIEDHGNVQFPQFVTRHDTGEFQNLRRIRDTGTQKDFPFRIEGDPLSAQ